MLKPLKVRNKVFEWGKKTYLVGVLNVTPDSFSDGGLYLNPKQALKRAEEMIEAGVDIIDIGGESTRPFAKPVPEEEEIKRTIPIIEAIRKYWDIPISIDTYKAGVAEKALKAGADVVNDISALRFDPRMAEVVAKNGVPVILMHMKGNPQTMQLDPYYEDVLSEISSFFEERVAFAEGAGIAREKIIIDPGLGFGKRFEDNLKIIKEIDFFKKYRLPILIGPSRKSFIGHIVNKEARERDAGTMATVAYLSLKKVDLIRVHNVAMARDVIKVIEAIREVR
ncbi:dihydropteroate synthase [Thermodesulfatator indicus DSM 15286]|uniref:Dihydropteroate synthase n=1 Tax=Thermodesulfatator indicus (strain DSM 15286 / JCM 11887 / CIR29812) TaxID=667014 RepID=F8A8F7_THEID|nr:dihydropteroate synthase [Thermodesulfatator indicus]AEH43962.1 dihydropteroate synthase [Thermodesulfatator indicus DSM 15286]